MKTLRLKATNTSRPRVARITGTHLKYGFKRDWVSGTAMWGAKEPTVLFDLYPDGIYEITNVGGYKRYIVMVGDEETDATMAMPRQIADYMRAHECDRATAYAELWGTLSCTFARMQKNQQMKRERTNGRTTTV